jgi:hypothetical protein
MSGVVDRLDFFKERPAPQQAPLALQPQQDGARVQPALAPPASEHDDTNVIADARPPFASPAHPGLRRKKRRSEPQSASPDFPSEQQLAVVAEDLVPWLTGGHCAAPKRKP